MLNACDVELTRKLERCEVPDEGFPHASHLRVAWVYLAESASLDEAIQRMGATLRCFASSVGHAEKYSDAITAFWMLQMAAARVALPGASFDETLRAYPRLLDKNLMQPEPHDVPATGAVHSSSDSSNRSLPGRSA